MQRTEEARILNILENISSDAFSWLLNAELQTS
jgi:hypothetical protein